MKDRLVRKRAYIKGQLTSYKNHLDAQRENPEPAILKVYNERLTSNFAKLNSLTDDLEELDPMGDHSTTRAVMEEEYCRLIGTGRDLESRMSAPALSDTSSAPGEQRSSPNRFGIAAATTRLPEQTLPKFDGKYEDWLSFKEDFQSSIGLRSDLVDTQKLKYLRSCLRGEPERLVRSFDTTNASYQEAWNLLKETFEHKGKIVDRHLSAIFGIPGMQRESSAELSAMISTAQLHLSALKALAVDERDCILVHILLQKLDKTTRRDWKRTQRGNKLATFDELISFLRETVLSSDDTAPARSTLDDRANDPKKGRGKDGDHATRGRERPKGHCFTTTATTECSVCKGAQHPVLRCQQFKALPPKKRREVAVKTLLCLNCLSSEHSTKGCGSRYTCMVCKQRHHTWLHDSEAPKTTPSTPSTSEA